MWQEEEDLEESPEWRAAWDDWAEGAAGAAKGKLISKRMRNQSLRPTVCWCVPGDPGEDVEQEGGVDRADGELGKDQAHTPHGQSRKA